MSDLKIEEIFTIGRNEHGYRFGVCSFGGVWLGFAIGELEDGDKMMIFLPNADDDSKTDRLIKLTGAIAQSPEHGYGGISEWFVEEELQGKPEDFMCAECGSVGCDPSEHLYDGFDEY